MVTAKVQKKYLVVVPKDVREKLGIKVDGIIEFKVECEKVVMVSLFRGRA